jgi:hypothetical protein
MSTSAGKSGRPVTSTMEQHQRGELGGELDGAGAVERLEVDVVLALESQSAAGGMAAISARLTACGQPRRTASLWLNGRARALNGASQVSECKT